MLRRFAVSVAFFLAPSFAIAFVVVVASHIGRRGQTLHYCNGGWNAAIAVFLQLSIAGLLIESLNWARWSVFVKPKTHSARSRKSVTADFLFSGRHLPGPSSLSWRVLLASLLGVFGVAVVGIPDACPDLDVVRFSQRLFLGGAVMMYAIFMVIYPER